MNKLYPFILALLVGGSLLAGTAFAETIATADEGFVERDDGARIYYRSYGEGEPMLLIHGYPLSGELFRDNVGPLAEEYRVITVDLRGFGMSSAESEEASIEIYAQDVLAVMDELGLEQAVVGGMSMGGVTVFEMVRQAPGRFRGLILIDTIHLEAGVAEAGLWRGVAEQAEEEGVSSLVDFLMPDMLSGEARMNRPELVEHLASLVTQASPEGAIGGANALADRPDYTELLEQIQVPVLIIVGLEDALTPFEVHEAMAETIPASQLVIIPGVAHAANLEGAEETNRAILEWAQGLE